MQIAAVEYAVTFLKRRWKAIAALAFVLAAYTAAGFLLVPWVAKNAIESYVRTDLSRRITIAKVSFNPFTFAAEIGGFALAEADGGPIVSFDSLRVRFALSSVIYRAWTFNEIRFERLDLSIVVGPDHSLNLSKLVPASPQSSKSTSIPAVRIANFAIHNGRIGVEDRSRTPAFATSLAPLEFTLTDFRTAANFENEYHFEGTTPAGERLTWSGNFSVQPLGSIGQFAISALRSTTIASYLADALPFNLMSGSLDLAGDYRIALADQMRVALRLSSVDVHDLGVGPKAATGGSPWITIPELQVGNVSVTLPERSVTVDRIAVTDAKLTVWREPDGRVNLMQLAPQSTPGAQSSAPQTAPSPPVKISVGNIAIQNAALDVEDRMVKPAVKLGLAPVSLSVLDYSTEGGQPFKIEADLSVGRGRLNLTGDVRMVPLATHLTLSLTDFDLTPLQPYVATAAAVQINSGRISAKGNITVDAAPEKNLPKLQYTGTVTLADFATRDTIARRDLAKWQNLTISGIDYAQGPDSLVVDRIQITKPEGRVFISPQQTLNIAAVLKPPGSAAAKTPVPTVSNAPAAKPAAQMPIRIRSIDVKDGILDFSDLSIQPNFAAVIGGLNGTISGQSSVADSRADVKLSGNVDRFAPVEITGKINLLSPALFSDIALTFRNIELTTFNPYSGKYAGYNIAKGKLLTELHYKIENRKLDLQHHVVLDQLEFGPSTNSKDAVPLPVRLAVALLKDRNGVIDLNLPVSGSMDDPMFRIGPIIWQAFVNLLTKIVDAPFAAIGAIFGGGEELSYIDFAPGSAEIAQTGQDKLAKLRQALSEHPQLRLDIPLGTVATGDDAALSDAAFQSAVMQMLPAGAESTPQGQLAALAMLYQMQFGAEPAYPMPETPDEDTTNVRIEFLTEQLRPRFMATQADRDSLARARADAVQSAILTSMMVAPENVFLSERASSQASASGGGHMELKLQ